MKKNPIIKVGLLVSYDWELLKLAIPRVYKDSDIIVLAIDKNRNTWKGGQFNLDVSFFTWIKEFDKDKKIKVYEDNFYLAELSPMENEVRERNLLAKFMDKGGWHIQLDADEYFLNFDEFVKFLKKIEPSQIKPVNVTCGWITLFKKLQSGYLIIAHQKSKPSLIPIATNFPSYEYGRMNGNHNIFSGQYIIHDSWARSEEGLWEKLSNWGHNNDFDINKFFNFWKSLDEANYKIAKNFHPLQPKAWQTLKYVKGEGIVQVIENFLKQNKGLITHHPFDLFVRNSKVINKIKSLLK